MKSSTLAKDFFENDLGFQNNFFSIFAENVVKVFFNIKMKTF